MADTSCARHSDPLDQDGNHDIAMAASIVFAFLIAASFMMRSCYMTARGLPLMKYVWPVDREVGLRPVGLAPTDKVSVLWYDAAGLCVYFLLDAWFRSAAFGLYGYNLGGMFGNDGWVDFFNPGQVDFHSHAWWIVLFSIICFVAFVAALMLRNTRYDILYNSAVKVPGKLRTWLRIGYATIRFNEGYIVPIAFLFFDPWVCDFSKMNDGKREYYVTGDCNPVLECKTTGYWFFFVIGAVLLFVLYLNFMLPTRSPVARWSMYMFGIPHLSPGTMFLRVTLAWSAKVLSHFDLCASLFASSVCNTLLFVCIALALDSRRLYMPAGVFVLGILAEAWILFYNFATIAAYGVDDHVPCILPLLVVLGIMLLYLLIVLALRQRKANEEAKYRQDELEAAKSASDGNPATLRMEDPNVVFVAGVPDRRQYTYQWKLNGRNMDGQVYSTCIVPQSKLDPEALVCVQLNKRDSHAHPVIVRQPKATPCNPGERVSLSCLVQDPHACKFQWFKDGEPIPGATGPNFSFVASDDNLGDYQCSVTNDLGNVTNSQPATVDYTPEEWARRDKAEEDRIKRERLEAEAARRAAEEAERKRIADLEAQRRAAEEEAQRRRREAEEAERQRRLAAEAEAKAAEDAAMAAMLAEAEAQAAHEMDRSQSVEPALEKAGYAEIAVKWPNPPVSDPSKLVYRVMVAEWDDDPSDDDPPEFHIMRPNGPPLNRFTLNAFHGEPIQPGEGYQVQVLYSLLDDLDDAQAAAAAAALAAGSDGSGAGAGAGAGASGRGGAHGNLHGEGPDLFSADDPRFKDLKWYGAGGPFVQTETKVPDTPVALLSGRFPRIWMLNPFEFETNKALLNPGTMSLLPEVVRVIKQVQDEGKFRIMVEGHVNFGQKAEAAQQLSMRRANTIRRKLQDSGVPDGILSTAGYGWRFPRFPRGSKFTRKNRRVEFRLYDPSLEDGMRPEE